LDSFADVIVHDQVVQSGDAALAARRLYSQIDHIPLIMANRSTDAVGSCKVQPEVQIHNWTEGFWMLNEFQQIHLSRHLTSDL